MALEWTFNFSYHTWAAGCAELRSSIVPAEDGTFCWYCGGERGYGCSTLKEAKAAVQAEYNRQRTTQWEVVAGGGAWAAYINGTHCFIYVDDDGQFCWDNGKCGCEAKSIKSPTLEEAKAAVEDHMRCN